MNSLFGRFPSKAAFPVWTILPALQVLLLCALASHVQAYEWLIFLSFILITSFSSWQLFADGHPYSLNKIWWLFGVVFLGIAPSVQTALHHSPWHEGDIHQATILLTNCLILLSLLLYSIVLFFVLKKISLHTISPRNIPTVYVTRLRIVTPFIMAACSIVLTIVYGWKGLFLRGYAEEIASHYDTTFQLIFDKGVRGMMLYLSLATILLYRKQKVSAIYCFLILVVSFLFNFPLAFSRNLAFAIYVAWLLTAGFLFVKTRYAFVSIILALLLLAAPLADVTRYAGKDMDVRISHPAALFKKAWLVSDYDAYSSLCRTVQYVDSAGSTHGRQLAGVALFFVPRKLWPQKPIGSGAYLFTQLNFDFKNVSCTYLAEGYINFGIIGMLLFVAVIAVIIALYDQWFWSNEQAFVYGQIFYPVCIGMMLFILRGDLLSSFAYTCGLFVSGWVLHRLFLLRAR